jgi:uncharacterized 2Fe-2S/4Fe-4S cluster protein (DUF4445 family)
MRMAAPPDAGDNGAVVGRKSGVGVAFDLGTTTIAGASVDLSTGGVIATASVPNPQARWGADVISRIEAVLKEPALLEALSLAAVEACNAIIEKTAPGAGSGAVREITVAGNTVMEHLLLRVPPDRLARPPYRTEFRGARRAAARPLGFDCDGSATLYAFPLIGGFVGGDAVAMALSTGLRSSNAALALDIGTNTEIILSSGKGLYATSAAAGPAFEGGGISIGMTARDGAIEGVAIRGEKVALEVIGGVSPRGICGSGLVKAASALLDAGVMESSGRIKGVDEVPNNLSMRITGGADGNSFVLYRGAGGVISLTQADIRALQAAKSAIRAGVAMLLKKAGLDAAGIKTVYLAGAFGSALDKEALAAIGVLDRAWLGCTETAGDASLDGAVAALSSDAAKREAEEIAASTAYVPLSGSPAFEREFIRGMDFPPA